MGFIYRMLNGLRSIGTFLVPVANSVRPGWGFLRVLGWIVHILLFLGILFLLRWVQPDWLRYHLRGRSEFIRDNWLAILFVLTYILGWLAYWLIDLILRPDDPVYPDITRAWDAAVDELRRNSIDLQELPIFVVLGRPAISVETLFDSSRLKYVVQASPHGDAPVSVYATSEAIYITTQGCSVMGAYCDQLVSAGSFAGQATYDSPDEPTDTIKPRGDDLRVKEILQTARNQKRPLTPEEQREIRDLMRKDASYQSCVRSTNEVNRLSARLGAFCSLLVRDRRPYCHLNGILLVIPLIATDDEQDALDAGQAANYDLSTLQNHLGVNCPLVAMLSDIETVPGAEEFLKQFSEKDRDRRIGQRCSKVPPFSATPGPFQQEFEARTEMLESLAKWLGNEIPASWVYQQFQLDSPSRGEDKQTVTRVNGKLFSFMNDLRNRHSRLAKVLIHSLIEEHREPIYFCGCYLAATGDGSENSQAFVKGVFHRLSDEEEFVTWTHRARLEEQVTEKHVMLASVTLGILIVLTIGLFGYFFFS